MLWQCNTAMSVLKYFEIKRIILVHCKKISTSKMVIKYFSSIVSLSHETHVSSNVLNYINNCRNLTLKTKHNINRIPSCSLHILRRLIGLKDRWKIERIDEPCHCIPRTLATVMKLPILWIFNDLLKALVSLKTWAFVTNSNF